MNVKTSAYIKILPKKYLLKSAILCLIFTLAGLGVFTQTILAANANLRVTGVVRAYTSPRVGEAVRFDVYVKNDGQASAPSSQVRLRLDTNNNGSFENTFYQGLGSLAVGNSLTASFNWTPGVAGTYGVESCADSANTVSELNENDNCSTQTFTVTGGGTSTPPPIIYPPEHQYAELGIDGVTRSHAAPNINDQVNFRVFIKNSGLITAPASVARLRIDSNNNGSFETVLHQNVSSIPAAESQTAVFYWIPSSAGTYGVESCADSSNTIAELNESNNCSVQTFNVVTSGESVNPPTPPGWANLRVTGVVRAYTSPRVGEAVRFDVYVKNDGQASAPSSQTRLRLDAGNNGSFENTFYQGLGSLAVGNSLTASFNWTPGVAGTYGVESCADSANTVSELNENDNCSTQTFTVTGSGSVTPPPVIYPPIIYPPQQPSPIYIPAPQQPQIIYQPSPSPQIIYQSSPSPQIIYQPPASPQIIQYPSYPAYYSYPYPYQSTLPDLSVVEVNLSPNLPRVNRLVTITAAIRNNSGVMRVEQSEAGLRIDDQASNTEDVRLFYNVDFIQPGDYRAVTFYWTPTMTGNHRLELCADSGGRITESDESNNCSIQYINVNSDTAYLLPAVSLYSVPFNINRGENSTLVWNTTNAANCFASEGWSGNKAASGSETIYPVNTRTYFLTCYNSYGQNSANTTVYVNGTSAVSKNLTASCVASPGSTVVGRQVTFAAGESGAIGTPSYVWSGDISGIGIINRKTFSSAGSKTATITVTDSAGRTATAQCRTQVNSAAVAAAPAKIYKPRPTAPKTKDACQQYPPGATIYNYYYNNGQQATNCSAAALDSQTSEPTTPAGPAISQDKPIAAVLSLGLGDTGRFFFWFSMAMLNLFLMAALVYIFFYIFRFNRQQKDI